MTRIKWYRHIHHNILVEPLTEPIENRIEFIREQKPAGEIELRLRLMKPVRGKLPKAVIKAYAAWDKACDKACDKAGKAGAAWDKACDKAYAAWDKALADNMPAIEALHKKECPGCPWNGKSIFPMDKP